MKEKESYFVLFLAIGIGILAFLSYDPVIRITERKESSESFFAPLPPRSRVEIPLSSEENKERLFLPSYADEELRSFRDIFTASMSFPQEVEMVAAVEELDGFSGADISAEGIQGEAPLSQEPPPIILKGMVTSLQGKAVIVDVDGRIVILTSQKPLQEGVKLVKVEGKEVTLEYQGREIVFSLSD